MMNDRTKRLSAFREKLRKNKDDSLSLDFAYITDDYNAAISGQNDTIRDLELQIKKKDLRLKKFETIADSCRILIDSTCDQGCFDATVFEEME